MKRRFLALLMALSLLVSLSVMPAFAAEGEDDALNTVRALGILVGDGQGNLDLSAPVTRAQFAKMMVVASGSSTDDTGGTVFKDVAGSYWAAGYIRRAVTAGWFVGYSDGTFRPNATITLEEACAVLLRLLGYDASSLTGAFPAAQLSKAAAIGLRDNLSASQGAALTRAECVTLFYNLMTCETKTGQIYAQTQGYTVTNGVLSYAALVEKNLCGPFVSDGSAPSLPFTADNITVYRNGAGASLSDINQYDVYYYNTYLRTLWVYTDRVSGTVTAVTPNGISPSTVTVAGVSYQLETGEAVYSLSDFGAFSMGDNVTLLLSRNGGVVRVLSAADSETVYYGVVVSSQQESTSTGSAAVQTSVRIACTDGVIRTFSVPSGSFASDTVVAASVDADGVSVKSVTAKTLTGSFNTSGTSFAGYSLASDIEILETADGGACASVLPSRLAGATFDSGVRYWTLNERGELDRLILGDATGDLWNYGILTSVSNSDLSSMGGTSGRYAYIMDGKAGTLSTTNAQYLVETGGAAFLYAADNSLSSIKNIRSTTVTELAALYLRSGVKKYLLAEDVQVYLVKNGSYYATTLSAVDTENYTLTAWYDSLGCPAGGLVRVLTATAK